jgi:hypothetical protein
MHGCGLRHPFVTGSVSRSAVPGGPLKVTAVTTTASGNVIASPAARQSPEAKPAILRSQTVLAFTNGQLE